MIFTGHPAPPQPRPTADRFSWDRPDFGGHIFEASYVDAEPMERDQ